MPLTDPEVDELMPCFIGYEEFLKLYCTTHPECELETLRARLASARDAWNLGLTCDCCGKPMWIIGSALYGWRGCRSCMAGPHSGPFLELADDMGAAVVPVDSHILFCLASELPSPNRQIAVFSHSALHCN